MERAAFRWFALFLLFCSPFLSAGLPPMREADLLYTSRNEEGHARRALALYRNEIANGEKSVDAKWRVSMASHYVGLHFELDSEEKKSRFKEGIEFGELATRRRFSILRGPFLWPLWIR